MSGHRWVEEGFSVWHYVDRNGKIVATLRKAPMSPRVEWGMDQYIDLDSAREAVERRFTYVEPMA